LAHCKVLFHLQWQPDFNYKADINLAFSDAGKISGDSLDIVKYAVSKGILKGRSNDVLDLDSTCSRQELMVFAKNVYEFVIYESGSESKGAFWKVSDEDSSIYLLGSIHVADSSLYPLSEAILNAYEAFFSVELILFIPVICVSFDNIEGSTCTFLCGRLLPKV
jgi:hypothetical protein